MLGLFQSQATGDQLDDSLVARGRDAAQGLIYSTLAIGSIGISIFSYCSGYCDSEPLEGGDVVALGTNCGDATRSLVTNALFPLAAAGFGYHAYNSFERAYLGRTAAAEAQRQHWS